MMLFSKVICVLGVIEYVIRERVINVINSKHVDFYKAPPSKRAVRSDWPADPVRSIEVFSARVNFSDCVVSVVMRLYCSHYHTDT